MDTPAQAYMERRILEETEIDIKVISAVIRYIQRWV